MKIETNNDTYISNKLITWYQTNRRELPWRETTNPYIIWISEIILQQTRVAQGLDYFNRFVARFPNVQALAEASEDEVLKYWQGLGYYSRARNLHTAAKTIMQQFGGKFPTDYSDVKSLKGIGDYTYFASYTPNSQGAYYPIVGNGITYRPDAYNSDLTWEKTTTYNAGIDLGFWNNRLTANIDYYYRKTTDLINTVFIAAGSNFSNKLTSNIGSLHNQGVELALTWRAIQMKDWSWELGYNVTWNSNEIDELVASQGDDYVVQYGGSAVGAGSSDGIKGWTVGQPSTAYYTYQQVYDENGQPIEGEFVDRDGNGVINGDDRYFYKKADPDVLMGLTSKLIYKNWDLSFSLRASLGNYNYNAVECSNSNLSSSSTYSGSTWHNVLDMARPKNWQQVSSTDALSDYFIQNASYLKCDNITLGYSFDKIGALALGGRIYFTAQNVFTVTKYKGLDPEVNGGYDSNIYPRPFMGILGVSLNF